MKLDFNQNIKAIILALAVTLGVGCVHAYTWTPPPACPPPTCNVTAPINDGYSAQQKLGEMHLQKLIAYEMTVTSATPIQIGQVLVPDINNTGHVKWGDLPNTGNNLPLKAYKITFEKDVLPGYSNQITYHTCQKLGVDGDVTCAKTTTAKLSDIVGASKNTQVSDDVETLNAVCATIFSDAKYVLNSTHNPTSVENYQLTNALDAVIYWDGSQFIRKTLGDGAPSGAVKFNSTVTCSSLKMI